MKFKNLFLILTAGIIIFSCGNDDKDESFDAAAQSIIDDELLIEYLQTHYLNEEDGGIWTITSGETALMGQVDVQEITKDDVKYNLYYLSQSEGVTVSPSSVDSIYFSYTGILLDSTVFDSRISPSWLTLDRFISGWQYGFTNFKGGNVVVNEDESFYFEDFGKGILFIPSGLAYGDLGSEGSLINENMPLIFEIELKDVHLIDHDFDGVLSKFEDLNLDNDLFNDDTNSDGEYDFIDIDDDGDGVLTKDEDPDEDGNPMNDDTDGDGTANYLDTDDDGDGILTIDEGDGDTDGDGTPDYLDPNN